MEALRTKGAAMVEVDLIGGFGLRVDGVTRDLPVRKSQLVLARLALASAQAVPRHDLRQMFWEMSDEAQAQVSLRQALARIRKGLGPAAGVLGGDLDTVRIGPGLVTDAGRLDAPVAAGARFDEALVTGELLAGQTPRETAAENWLAAERSRIRQKQTGYCLAVAQSALAAADHESALQAALRGLLLDNLDERLHLSVMRAYVGLGNRSAALDQYRQCEAILRDELGVGPEAATRDLAQRLRAAQPSGAPLAMPPMPEKAAAAEEEETEIRLASVICVGPPPSDDPEDYGAIADASLPIIDSLAADYGAAVVPGDGGERFLVLGVRGSSESDPVRAAALAHALLQQLPSLRAGVASGRIVVTHCGAGGIRISGEPRGRALSLLSQAAVGRVVISEQALACRPSPVFVGREVELGYLDGLFERCQGGSPTVAVVQGEPGIGKSRLTEGFAARIAARGMEVLRIGFEPFGQSIGAARALCRAAVEAGGELPESAGPAAYALFADMTGFDGPAGGASLLSAMSEDRRQALAIEVARQLLLAIPVHAAAILVEDAHWAKRNDIGFLIGLANVLPGLRAMMVATERISGAQFGPAMASRPGETMVSTLTLTPFSRQDALALARVMGIDDTELAEAAAERSKGNPLFLACLLETARGRDGGLPATILGLVQEQTDLLPPDSRLSLRRAAILGKSFDPAHYAAIFGPVNWGSLLAAGCLHREQNLQVFPHALVHEAVYAGLTRADRQKYHAQAAAFFAEVDPVLWADHALAADLPVAARACSDAADLLLPRHEFERGLGYINAGLERARETEDRALLHIARGSIDRERGNLDSALADYEAASGEEVPPRVRLQALVRRAWVHRLRGELTKADDILAVAGDMDLSKLPADLVSEYENQLGAQAWMRGDFEACARHNRRARDLATTPLHVSRALGGLGDALYAEGRMQSALETFRECNALARSHGLGVVELVHLLLEAEALRYVQPGPQSIQLVELILERARDADNARVEMMTLATLAELLSEDGRWQEANDCAIGCQAVVGRTGAGRFSSWQICIETMIAAHESRCEAHRRIAGWLERTAPERPDWLRSQHYALLALTADDPVKADEALAAGARLAAGGEARFVQFWYHRLAIDAAFDLGRADLIENSVAALRQMTGPEPLAWTDLVIRRGELLADFLHQGASEASREAARHLRGDLAASLQSALVPALDRAFGLAEGAGNALAAQARSLT